MKRVKNPPPVTVECPACKAPCTIEEADLEVGDCLVCDQCDEALTVVTVSPLVLQVDDPDEDDDLDDDDDEDEDEDEDDGLNDDDDEG
jgi:hypothetical protein